MRKILLIAIWLSASLAQARLPSGQGVSTHSESAILALDNSLENYYGNQDSAHALGKVRLQLLKVQSLGVATRIPSVLKLDDSELKKVLDEQSIQVAFVSSTVKECSYVVMTVLALSQGKCPKRPVFEPPPAIELYVPRGSR